MPESMPRLKFPAELFLTLGHQDEAATTIDLSQRTRALEAVLNDRLTRRAANNPLTDPTPRKTLNE
jgi:hypothetical protein